MEGNDYMLMGLAMGSLDGMEKLIEDYIADPEARPVDGWIAPGTPVGKPGVTACGDAIIPVGLTISYYGLYQKENPDKRPKDFVIEFAEKYGQKCKELLGGILFLHLDITKEEGEEITERLEKLGIGSQEKGE